MKIVGAFVLLTLIWGTTWATIRVGLAGIPPFTGVALRFAIASILLLSLSPALGVRYRFTRREMFLWFVNGTLSFAGSYGIVYWCEQWVPSGLASVLFATFPLFVAVLAHFFLDGERLNPGSAAGVLLGFSGVAVLFSEDFARLGGPQVATASVVMLASPIVAAIANVVVKRWGSGIHPVSLASIPMGMAAASMGVIAALAEREREVVFDSTSISALLYLAVMGSAVTFTLYYWLLTHISATRLSLIAYTAPIVAVAVGAIALDEPITTRMLVGSAVVVVGVALAVRRPPSVEVP